MHRIWIFVAIAALCGCSGVPNHLEAVSGFDVTRYTGTWYEVARFPHVFEEGLSAVTANYTLQNDGTVAVENRGYKASQNKWNTAQATARFAGAPDVGYLKVTFFWPFSSDYKVVRLGEDYEYALVVGKDFNYFWILSRTPTLDETIVSELVSFAANAGFDTSRIVDVDQTLNLP